MANIICFIDGVFAPGLKNMSRSYLSLCQQHCYLASYGSPNGTDKNNARAGTQIQQHIHREVKSLKVADQLDHKCQV